MVEFSNNLEMSKKLYSEYIAVIIVLNYFVTPTHVVFR